MPDETRTTGRPEFWRINGTIFPSCPVAVIPIIVNVVLWGAVPLSLRGSWSSTSCCLSLHHFDTHENGIIIPLNSPSVIEPTETPHFRCWNLNVSWTRPQTKPQLPASVICDSDVKLHWCCFGYTDLRSKGCPQEAPWTEDPYMQIVFFHGKPMVSGHHSMQNIFKG